jgi:phosphomannomutase
MQPPFVKKFDFRGIYNKDIKDKDAFYLGFAIQKTLPLKKILIGWDTRVSSMSLAFNFMQSFKDSGVEISYLETCPIDFVTAGTHAFDFDFSVMFTGSHNPWDWSGLLMHTAGGASVDGALVTKIIENYNAALTMPHKEPTINILDYHNFQNDIEHIYKEKISTLIPLDKIKKMKVVVDIGDGSGYGSLDILEKLLPQVTFDRLNDRKVYDADTPHMADPSNIENMAQVIDAVKHNHYDCGFAFDSDADRVLGVDETGEYINGSLIGSAMIEVFSELKSLNKKFGYAVECGPSMYNTVVELNKNGRIELSASPVPVGRSILRGLLREAAVDVAVENVGHFYIKDFFMTDSGAFSIVLLLYWISIYGNVSTLRSKHPDGQRTQFHLPQAENQEEACTTIIQTINPHFEGKENRKIDKDGIRYEFFENGTLQTWYAMRPSGYEKIEKYYFGSLNEEDYTFLKEKLHKDS